MSICDPCRAGADLLARRPLDERAQKIWQSHIVTLPVLSLEEYACEMHALCVGCPCHHQVNFPPPIPLSPAQTS